MCAPPRAWPPCPRWLLGRALRPVAVTHSLTGQTHEIDDDSLCEAVRVTVFVHRLALSLKNTDIWRALLCRCAASLVAHTAPRRVPPKRSDVNRVPDTGDLCSSVLAAPFYTARRARAYQSSTCSSSASAIRAAPLVAELPSMLRRSDLLGEQHAGALHGARPGAHRLRASCAKVTPAARRHRDLRRERRVASVRTLALIRVASLVTRAATKHSLGGSGTARRESTWGQFGPPPYDRISRGGSVNFNAY